MDEREVELQRARREGYVAAMRLNGWHGDLDGSRGSTSEDIARQRYPITVRKPREVRDPQTLTYWRVRDGVIEWRGGAVRAETWQVFGNLGAGQAAIVADLLANPNEDVTE